VDILEDLQLLLARRQSEHSAEDMIMIFERAPPGKAEREGIEGGPAGGSLEVSWQDLQVSK
jgi:hypothetical protein